VLCRSILSCRNRASNSDDCRAMGSAFETCLQTLVLTDRNDPVAEAIAKKIIELRQRGERDPDRLCQLAMGELGL
jgi:hypothetical protein